MRSKTVFYLFLIFGVNTLVFPLQAQSGSDSIDFGRISHMTVQNYLMSNHIAAITDLMELTPTCIPSGNRTKSQTAIQYHLIRTPIDTVWKYYSQVTADQAWNDRIVSLSLLISRNNKKIYYQDEANQSIEVGAIVLANIRLLFGLLKLGVAFEITEIDPISKTIRICYLEHNKSNGTQEIRLEAMPDGITRVVHLSNYYSDSPFRDKFLYPFFHRITVGEFHRNLTHLIESHIIDNSLN